MIVTEFWAECVCGAREQVEALDTYPPGWPVMVDSDGRHYACTRGCLVLLMADPTCGRQLIPPLPHGIGQIDLRLLELVALDCTNVQIGMAVCLSPHTVKNRLTHTYRTLGARTRTSALLLAHARGLINLSRLAQTSAERVNAA